jgi:hypothetical protein
MTTPNVIRLDDIPEPVWPSKPSELTHGSTSGLSVTVGKLWARNQLQRTGSGRPALPVLRNHVGPVRV